MRSRRNICVKVIPNADRNEVQDREEGYRVRVSVPARDGKANRAVLELMAKELGVRRSALRIIRGEKARNKIIEIVE